MRFFGSMVFGSVAVVFTILAFMFPYAWALYLPVVLIVWLAALLFTIHGLRPRS